MDTSGYSLPKLRHFFNIQRDFAPWKYLFLKNELNVHTTLIWVWCPAYYMNVCIWKFYLCCVSTGKPSSSYPSWWKNKSFVGFTTDFIPFSCMFARSSERIAHKISLSCERCFTLTWIWREQQFSGLDLEEHKN